MRLIALRMRVIAGGDSGNMFARFHLAFRRPLRGPNRPAGAQLAAELAICLPLIVFLLLASLEACSMIFLDHSLTIASYEGVRMGINRPRQQRRRARLAATRSSPNCGVDGLVDRA